ncbi:MAG TPA: cell surface protein SprA [Gemmatimonadaceae bacterium]|nr:cell surface protein SprA [Gemmatimonadaceae bacterium]
MRSPPFLASSRILAGALLVLAAPRYVSGQGPPADTAKKPPTDTTRRIPLMPRPPADTDTSRRSSTTVIPGLDLPVQFDLRIEGKKERDRNLRCNSLEAIQVSEVSGCRAGFLPLNLDFRGTLKTAGVIGDRVHVNVDYDMQREFDASNTVSLYYEGAAGSHWRRVDVGNIAFAPPSSRFITSSLPSGNYGFQITNQFGALRLKSIFATQTGNVVQNRQFTIGARTRQTNERDIDDYQIERLRFFFTIDPALFRGAYPNIDILDRAQLRRLAASLPDTLRPTRVLLYRLQFGTQPQNPKGPRFRVRGAQTSGTQTYDLLREGVDYVMDPSLLWFALVRPLNETNERLVVAYNVRINGRDTIWTSTGGTPDLQYVPTREQVANLVMDPNVGPSSPAFRNEIRSIYRVAGDNLIRQTAQLRVVTGSGLLEHPIAGNDATFLQMLGLAQPTNPAAFDFQNRLWPRESDGVFNLGAGAADIRNGQSLDVAKVIRDYFLVLPSLRPFSARDSGLVVPGNPTNDAIYTIPGEYLYSQQHPAGLYRFHLKYDIAGSDEGGALTINAAQMRPGSERVLLDGRPLVRDLDYRIDYDLGRLEFMRPDTLFASERHVDVRYEENLSFGASPITLAGFVSELPVPHGTLNFLAINQSQRTSFTRPQLGLQSNSTLTTGATGQFNWDAPALTRLVSRLPFGETKAASHISLIGEIATSHPQFAARNQGDAFVETFENGGGFSVALSDQAWYYSSLPAYGSSLRSRFGPGFFEPANASTLVWQTNVQTPTGRRITLRRSEIDPLLRTVGTGLELNEPALWLTLLPLDQTGKYNRSTKQYDWTTSTISGGRRFRSIRTVLSPTGLDLTRNEFFEFWTLLDPSAGEKNPTLIFDFGDVSENSVSFGPDTLKITHNANGTVDSVYSGRKLQGFDRLDSERDPFSRAFNADVNDTGLPGDVVDTIVVVDGSTVRRETQVRICRGAAGALDVIGDPRTNCTVANAKLDEEDIDLDNALNFASTERENERVLRYIVDLGNPATYKRLGGTFTDTVYERGLPQPRTRRWVLVSVPFKSPADSLNDVNRRKIRALRLTMVSGQLDDPETPIQLPIAELKLTGAPWLDRDSRTLAGIAGIRPVGGFVITSTIGTTDSSAAIVYQPPPGVGDQPDVKGAQFQGGLTPINESSMRIQAGSLDLFNRAEAYLRFPTGPQHFLGFERLRVWGRGRKVGWGQGGELQMYVKVGRDENNFYMYRSPVNAGQTQAAWTDLDVDLSRFVDLRRKIQAAYLAGKTESIACTGVDSAIIAASPVPGGTVAHPFAACADGYMVYTIDPAVTAPNLAAVQEIAVGILRVGGGGPGGSMITTADTLELWVDDIRLEHPTNTTGVAGQIGLAMNAGDFLDLRLNVSNRNPNFRQLGEEPSFLGERTVDMGATVRLDKLLPRSLGLALPLTITKLSTANDPFYLSQTDIRGAGIPGLRKPKNDLTTYSLTVRRTTPVTTALVGPLVNNLSATSTYVTGIDRTEFQNGNAHNFTFALDYLVTDDTARTARLPGWIDGSLGVLPAIVRAGPIDALRASTFRWNPTQLRITSGIVRGDDRRTSFIRPSSDVGDDPAVSTASSRLWRNGGTLAFHPTTGTDLRWEIQSIRDFRDYRDSTADPVATQRGPVDVAPGFERERTMLASFSLAPAFSTWFRPRADVGTQYDMLRDPNSRRFTPLPGVIGVDSVLATRDSLAALQRDLPRRMTAAQTASIGSTLDVGAVLATYMRDSSAAHNIGQWFTPVDLSYTRSLLSAVDAAPSSAPLSLQFGIAGPAAFRTIRGLPATTAGETGTWSGSTVIRLPLGAAVENRFRRTTTLNWIVRPDSSQAQVNGSQVQFPDVNLRWAFRPATLTAFISNLDAGAGYVRSSATVSLPNLIGEAPPNIRRSHSETFPVSASIAWAVRGGLSTGARYSYTRRVDSLPGSIAQSRVNELGIDAGRAFRIPESWGLGLRNDVRARLGVQESHLTTFVVDGTDGGRSRLQDNGRESFNLTADTNLSENLVFTFQGSHIITFDNNLNRRFAQTVFSTGLQIQFFGAGK